MRKYGHPDWTAVRVVSVAMVGILSATAVASFAGLRINTSYSLPLGVYIRTNDPHADLVEFCPAKPFAAESSSRGYRTVGTGCPDGAVPLLKRIVAVVGDHVVFSPAGIRVNGTLLPKTAPLYRDRSGRRLHPWPFGSYTVGRGSVWVASTYNVGSYDSRYMGPIKTDQIRGRLRPLWLL